MNKLFRIIVTLLIVQNISANGFGGGTGVRPEQRQMLELVERNGSVGGAAGGGGVKSELERIINFHSGGGVSGGTSTDQRQVIERSRENVSFYEDTVFADREVSVVHGQVQFNLNEIEEVTLKDGSVVKYFELLELMKK